MRGSRGIRRRGYDELLAGRQIGGGLAGIAEDVGRGGLRTIKAEPDDSDGASSSEVREIVALNGYRQVRGAVQKRRPLRREIVRQTEEQRQVGSGRNGGLENIPDRGVDRGGDNALAGGVANLQNDVGNGVVVESG